MSGDPTSPNASEVVCPNLRLVVDNDASIWDDAPIPTHDDWMAAAKADLVTLRLAWMTVNCESKFLERVQLDDPAAFKEFRHIMADLAEHYRAYAELAEQARERLARSAS